VTRTALPYGSLASWRGNAVGPGADRPEGAVGAERGSVLEGVEAQFVVVVAEVAAGVVVGLQADGKVERYQRITAEEVLYAREFTSEDARSAAIAVWNIQLPPAA
jgi:hypothetical protein